MNQQSYHAVPIASEAATRAARRGARASRGGFSFIEVLFAVMILGIGFIMIAGIFPVAISQTQTSAEEGHAASIARGGVAYLEKMPYTSTLMNPDKFAATPDPNRGILRMFDPAMDVPVETYDAAGTKVVQQIKPWDMIKGNLIHSDDPRYAWVPLWRRPYDANGQPESYAQVIVVAVQCRNHGRYDASDVDRSKVGAGLIPKVVNVKYIGDTQIEVSGANAGAVMPGAFILPIGANGSGMGAGLVLKVGTPESDAVGNLKFNLEPGADLTGVPTGPNGNRPPDGGAYIIGRGQTPGTTTFSGGVQDIAAYTTFIQLK